MGGSTTLHKHAAPLCNLLQQSADVHNLPINTYARFKELRMLQCFNKYKIFVGNSEITFATYLFTCCNVAPPNLHFATSINIQNLCHLRQSII